MRLPVVHGFFVHSPSPISTRSPFAAILHQLSGTLSMSDATVEGRVL
jgi:hypothetical protein